MSSDHGNLPRHLALFGCPVAHSVSPAMHNEAFRQQQMNCTYSAYHVEPHNLKAAVEGLRAMGFLGANITLPHKEAIIPYLDEIAPTAAQIGAVNTVVNRSGRLIGYNTDGWGFITSLEESGVKPKGLNAVVLGAGGAARAIAVYLSMAGVDNLIITNRTASRAEQLIRELSAVAPEVRKTAVEANSPEERRALAEAEIVVNCTPLGMFPDTGSTALRDIGVLPQRAVVCDTIYRPMETRMLREARQRGLRAVGGLRMLVHQGACAWEYWFGRRGPVRVMFNAAKVALEEHKG